MGVSELENRRNDLGNIDGAAEVRFLIQPTWIERKRGGRENKPQPGFAVGLRAQGELVRGEGWGKAL